MQVIYRKLFTRNNERTLRSSKKLIFFKNFCFWLYVTTGYTTVSLSKSNILTMTQSLQITSFAAVEKHLTTDMLGWPETEPLVLTGQLKLLQ